jgi:transposase
MQLAKVLSNILGMKKVRVRGCEFVEDGLVIDVSPTTRIARCGGCGCRVRRLYDHRRGRLWRHLDLGGMKVQLRYDLRRVDCSQCGVRTEFVPWAEPDSMFTRPFEDQVAYLAQRMDKTAIVGLMRIAWYTVGSIAQRVVQRLLPPDRLSGLRVLGVDELSYRKHHKYVTIITDHESGKVVWAKEGKSAATLDAFFAELGKERCAQLRIVTMDLSQAYIASVKANAPQAQVVFDRFHVQRLAHDALDEVRRALVAEHTDTEQRRALKKTRFVLQKNAENRSSAERRKVAQIQTINRPLYRAMLLKDSLGSILDRRQYYVARDELQGWLAWASRSKLTPFVRVARTIRKHLHGVLAYLNTGLSNGRSEGLNGKARVITRRSYGLHSAPSLIAMLFLCCSIPSLTPVRVFPNSRPLTH